MPPHGGCWACGILPARSFHPRPLYRPLWGYQGLAAMPPGHFTPGQNRRRMGEVNALGKFSNSAAGGANHPNAADCDSQCRSGICGQGDARNISSINLLSEKGCAPTEAQPHTRQAQSFTRGGPYQECQIIARAFVERLDCAHHVGQTPAIISSNDVGRGFVPRGV